MSLVDKFKGDWQKGYKQGKKDVENMTTFEITEIVNREDEDIEQIFNDYHDKHGEELSDIWLKGWIQAIRDSYKEATHEADL